MFGFIVPRKDSREETNQSIGKIYFCILRELQESREVKCIHLGAAVNGRANTPI